MNSVTHNFDFFNTNSSGKSFKEFPAHVDKILEKRFAVVEFLNESQFDYPLYFYGTDIFFPIFTYQYHISFSEWDGSLISLEILCLDVW